MTQQQGVDVTQFDQQQVANLQTTLEDMRANGLRIRYENVVPTTKTLQENEIVIYDDGTSKNAYTITGEGNLFSIGGTFSGFIGMFSGSIGSIPSDWALCDGTNGTPDLRDRFVVGAGSTYSVGATGGATTHSHGGATGGVSFGGGGTLTAGALDTAHTHPISSDSNLPPYYALAYIMKL